MLGGLFAALAVATFVCSWKRPPARPKHASVAKAERGYGNAEQSPAREKGIEAKNGRELARQVCSTCHFFPEPDIANRSAWENVILPRMGMWLGYDTVDWKSEPGAELVLASGKVPDLPIVDLSTLKAIHDYYLGAAPPDPLPQPEKPTLRVGLKHFRVRSSTYRNGHPATTLVKIDERSRRLFIGDSEAKKLLMLKPDGSMAASMDMPNPIVQLLERPDGFVASLVGSVVPSDLSEGQVTHLKTTPRQSHDQLITSKALLSGLRRPVECAVADFNQDGREDLAVAGFGNVLGHFSWYERTQDSQYEEHVLLDRPGAVGVKVSDFDGDGRPDIVALMAQALESISVFLNRGHGRFEETVITQKHPGWGFSHLEMVDFDLDGKMDLLVTNGDNGENTQFANCLKPYHGVRLYLNEGRGRFREAWFYPMYGAYRALARDFDLDGDIDIAAISFFPDYLGITKESFTYLEHLGGLKFEASTFVQSITGRWITVDAGDLDGDGDADIVLGAFNRSFGDVPDMLGRIWAERGPCFLLLENTVR